MARSDLALFPTSYHESRQRFHARLAEVQRHWPSARLERQSIDAALDLSIDWIYALPTQRPERLLVLTTGLHGVEGFVGAAMLQLFLNEFAARLTAAHTGLLLVHAINPWGMLNRRRTNAANVDLNRSFLYPDDQLPDPGINPDYAQLLGFLQPQQPIQSIWRRNLGFVLGLLGVLAKFGSRRLRVAMTLGQYRFAQGLYYGGRARQPEVRCLMQLFREQLLLYRHVVLLDMHTGYGPRHPMSLVNSAREPRLPAQLQHEFNYPAILRSNPDEFYRISGDMIDWLYELVANEFPSTRLYATTFEFGTLGDSTLASLRTLRALLYENQFFWHGGSPEAHAAVLRSFSALFEPGGAGWRRRALADARRAFVGILHAEGFL